MNYLTAVSNIQDAQSHSLDVDEESAAIIAVHCTYFSPETLGKINFLEPWLFATSRATTDEKQKYYHKVWRLLYHFNHRIRFPPASHFWQLGLVTPSFCTLEVTVVVCSLGRAEEKETHTLGKYDTEDLDYILERTDIRIRGDPGLVKLLTDGLGSIRDTSSRTVKNGRSTQSDNDHSHDRPTSLSVSNQAIYTQQAFPHSALTAPRTDLSLNYWPEKTTPYQSKLLYLSIQYSGLYRKVLSIKATGQTS